MTDINEILKKYGKKIDQQAATEQINTGEFSREYQKFKKELVPDLSRFEKLCKSFGSVIKLKLAKKDNDKIQKYLDIAHLEVSPSEVTGLSLFSLFSFLFFGALITTFIYLITKRFDGKLFMFFFLMIVASFFSFYYSYTTPQRLANKWRLKSSSQMVPCILYIVVYMKHTSNLERAIAFAAQHLSPPLSLDLRKVFWDIETGRFSNIKDSLDYYLESWRETNIEFIEAFHLIESSLFEPSEDRRVATLERSLQVILEGVYEKMLSYSRDIRSPLTNLYMLGIILPTLGIALLPLASTLLGGMLQWYHVFVLFNILIPFFVFYMTSQVLLKRPGGYGETELLEMNPDYQKFVSNKSYLKAFFICLPFFLLSFLPLIFQYTPIPSWIGLQKDYSFKDIGLSFLGDIKLFDFKNTNGVISGPFGPAALLLSLFFPLGLAFFFSIVYNNKTKDLIRARKDSKGLEDEFANSLFQLGNRLGDGVPAEIAFAQVASSTKGQVTEGFFKTVNSNIQNLGMSVENAIFNSSRGAIIYYPSSLISTSMKILIESVKKGLQVAARSLMSISEYIKNIKKINERMRDLLAEVVSDMKSNMVFLAPLLSGIVIGLAGMITLILTKLNTMINSQDLAASGLGANMEAITKLFDITLMISPYYLQLVIGIYIVEIIFILTSTLVTVDAGEDKLRTKNEIGKNLKRSILLYFVVAGISILSLGLLASIALGGLIG